jgi:octaheme c-type cytochrome (tetrathionate reductase family)
MKTCRIAISRVATAAFFVFVLLCVAARSGMAQPAVHSLMSRLQYSGAETCLLCHGTGGMLGQDIAGEIMHSSHWTWTHTNQPAGHAAQVMGKRNIVNNYCIATASNEPRCTSCHIGVGWRDSSFDFNDANKIDCLVCHDTTGTYKKVPTGAGVPDPSLNLTNIAVRAGKTSRATCGACHFYGGGGDAVKHGDMDSTLTNPTRELDVHMGVDGANMNCVDCHKSTEANATAHDLVGSRYSKPNPDNWLCEDCHSPTPHWNSDDGVYYNAHTGRIACQTCHVPRFARGGKATKMTWDWSTAGIKGTNGAVQQIKDANGDVIYDTMKGTFTWAKDVVPDYVWFNGSVIWTELDDKINPAQMLTLNQMLGSKNQGRARIIPVKRFTAVQPYDAVSNTLVIPHLFPLNANDTNAYWKGYNWTNAANAGMAAVGKTFSGQMGWARTEMFWVQNHMVAPKEQALTCTDCHSPDGRIPFEELGYEPGRAARLHDLNMIVGKDHTGRFPQGYADSSSCTVCHPDAASEVMHTSHWTWEHTDSVTGQVFGKKNVINNYCVAVASNEPRCTSCHVGVGYRDKTFDFSDARKVDCLVCHDTTGTYKKFPTLAGAPWTGPGTNVFGGASYPPVNLNLVAEKVGKTSRQTCGACHFYGGGGDAVKHGDLDSTLRNPSRDLDVHMGTNGLNYACADCHKPDGGHDIPGTYYTKDYADSKSCEICHTSAPHAKSGSAAPLNQHTSRVGCQTCHIPHFARGRTTTMTWDWSTAGVKTNGQNFVVRDANGDPIYDTQKGTFTWAKNVVPEYVWFNGQVDYLTVTSVIDPTQRVKANALHGSQADPRSRIMPIKRFTGRQPYDPVSNVLAVPNLFPNDASDTNAYWRTFNWTNAMASGMAYLGQPFSGEVGWVDTEWAWIENHMVAPKEAALTCAQCHTPERGRLDFAALGYDPSRVALLQTVLQSVQSFTYEQTPEGLKLRWASIPGHTYELLSTADLESGQWEKVGTSFLATGMSLETLVPRTQINTETRRFFRIRDVAP